MCYLFVSSHFRWGTKTNSYAYRYFIILLFVLLLIIKIPMSRSLPLPWSACDDDDDDDDGSIEFHTYVLDMAARPKMRVEHQSCSIIINFSQSAARGACQNIQVNMFYSHVIVYAISNQRVKFSIDKFILFDKQLSAVPRISKSTQVKFLHRNQYWVKSDNKANGILMKHFIWRMRAWV